MALTSIDTFLDNLSDDWMRTTFVDRLDNARMVVDDATFGDVEGANAAFSSFMALTLQERITEISRLRTLNMVDQWANSPSSSIADINSIITSLRSIRDAKQAAADAAATPEPEPETPSESGGE